MGRSVHLGDFRAQCWRTFRNINELLKAEEMTWHDIVRTSCYLRDMSRDYEDFNENKELNILIGLDWMALPARQEIRSQYVVKIYLWRLRQ